MNISIPSNLKKRCYEKGISLYNHRLEPKNQNRLVRECANGSSVHGNENTKAYGVPPRPERARAVRKAQPHLTVNEALALAEPFYSFENPMYLPGSPIRGNKNSLSYTIGHDVWTIVPNYFSGPSANAPRPNRKKTLPTAEQTRAKKEQDAKRDQKYKQKWGTKTKAPGRTTRGPSAPKKHFKK